MSTFTPMRDAGATPPQIWLVDPNGYARRMPAAGNIGNGHTEKDSDGRDILRGKDRDAGWKFLHEVISSAEMKVWLDYHAQSDAVGGRIQPLPDDKWPKGIRNPRVDARGRAGVPKAEYEPGAGSRVVAPPPSVTAGAPADKAATSTRSRG